MEPENQVGLLDDSLLLLRAQRQAIELPVPLCDEGFPEILGSGTSFQLPSWGWTRQLACFILRWQLQRNEPGFVSGIWGKR